MAENPKEGETLRDRLAVDVRDVRGLIERLAEQRATLRTMRDDFARKRLTQAQLITQGAERHAKERLKRSRTRNMRKVKTRLLRIRIETCLRSRNVTVPTTAAIAQQDASTRGGPET